MTNNKECGLLLIINSLPDGVEWLVRSDDQGAFANVMSPEFSASNGAEGMASGAYASTPVTALECAYKDFKAKEKLFKL